MMQDTIELLLQALAGRRVGRFDSKFRPCKNEQKYGREEQNDRRSCEPSAFCLHHRRLWLQGR